MHGLVEDDPDRRMQMCETFLSRFEEDDQLMRKLIWSNEAKFVLHGSINRHNCIYYDTVNPCITVETQLKQPGITAWGAISTEGLIGLYFFNETVNRTNYQDMLSNYVLPQLQQRPDYNSLIFMQDGAPPHYVNSLRNLLNTLPGGWIGRRGTIEWAIRSSDLTPMDFFLWVAMKDPVYNNKPYSLDDRKMAITTQFNAINSNKELCTRVCESVISRITKCIEQNGWQFEHLL